MASPRAAIRMVRFSWLVSARIFGYSASNPPPEDRIVHACRGRNGRVPKPFRTSHHFELSVLLGGALVAPPRFILDAAGLSGFTFLAEEDWEATETDGRAPAGFHCALIRTVTRCRSGEGLCSSR